ncbi:Putative inner membrane protein [Lachnospiraceae bacterium NE2001]|nr:Putative inner membrane protein [Lachnospiraceae bacterium NE2001]
MNKVKRNKYSAGAVKFMFWFLEFRKEVQLLAQGKSFDEIKSLSEEENIFGASTPARATMIQSTLTARIKYMDPSFYDLFLESDVATQKLYALTGCFVHDTLFFDFMYEVVREKMIIGTNVLSDADIHIFFKNKQEQSEVVAKWTDQTITRLGRSYKTQLFEAGILDDNKMSTERMILKPILDPIFKHWLEDFGYSQVAKALEGIR